jgi:hypothetical protein
MTLKINNINTNIDTIILIRISLCVLVDLSLWYRKLLVHTTILIWRMQQVHQQRPKAECDWDLNIFIVPAIYYKLCQATVVYFVIYYKRQSKVWLVTVIDVDTKPLEMICIKVIYVFWCFTARFSSERSKRCDEAAAKTVSNREQ